MYHMHFYLCTNTVDYMQQKLVESNIISSSHIILFSHTVILNTAFPKFECWKFAC